ncbi:plasmid partitioning protein RepB [Bosea rubneri]|uniref:Plasmid partitioning protein RepB n=1 Tax=Bosea rubneri TaxID=3075434 RepID=A0ABU3SG58_9HYPH|nr:plasmid partitioning protein RepB [Bosea sp. ZW T0_25]MDU0343784.1 plasmid partitioning protein RepB [Bosea sp. ZW T0_25]
MSRRDTVNSLFFKKPEAAAPSPAKSPERVRTGAVAAMGASLQEMSENAKVVDKLRQQLSAGETVVGLNPSQVDGSTVSDRIAVEVDPGFEQLAASIADNGQQVPILVRPHPREAGRFQIAYGRRRLRAAAKLGREVKAIVRELSDAELIVAQGRENLDREDLSFIEKALFAKRLEDAGYDRHTIIAALSTDKADLSRYITIARRIPEPIIHRIGPAPKSGRARWLGLAEKLEDTRMRSAVDALLKEARLSSLDSDERFRAVWQVIDTGGNRPASSSERVDLRIPGGRRLGQATFGEREVRLAVDAKAAAAFSDFMRLELPELMRRFAEHSGG